MDLWCGNSCFVEEKICPLKSLCFVERFACFAQWLKIAIIVRSFEFKFKRVVGECGRIAVLKFYRNRPSKTKVVK